jgi:hypothetical protein
MFHKLKGVKEKNKICMVPLIGFRRLWSSPNASNYSNSELEGPRKTISGSY